jgi:hypothetical protein
MRILLLLCAASCAAYRPGSFATERGRFAGEHATVGCLDVAVSQRTRVAYAAVLDITFGNRCSHPATVDLAAMNVVGRSEDGREVAMVAHDPNHEIRPLPLDGRAAGHEAIAYAAERSEVAQICADLGAIAHAEAHWVCFARDLAIAEVSQ